MRRGARGLPAYFYCSKVGHWLQWAHATGAAAGVVGNTVYVHVACVHVWATSAHVERCQCGVQGSGASGSIFYRQQLA